jgi:site-specific DNA-cytosine methylase
MCAGYGGIGLGIKNIFGERLRTIAYCELEGFAQANLISKMEKGLLDAAPIWSDLKTFPYESFHGLVDILIAGYPCQPFSAAGKRAGKEDPRHLWPWIADGIRLLQPTMCFFENVEGHISLGLSTVISDLEELGYKVSWGIFSASEVGAPHQRKRVFIMAHNNSERVKEFNRGVTVQLLSTTIGDCCIDTWPSRPGQQQYAWEPPRVVGSVPAKLANFCSRDSQSGGDTAQASGESVGSWGQSEDAMFDCGSSIRGGDQGDESTPRVTGAIPRKLADTNNAGWEAGGHNAISIQGRQPHELAARECDKEPAGMANTHCGRGEEPEHQHTNLPSEPSGGNSEAVGNADYWRLASGINAGSGAEADRGGQGDFEQADCGTMGNSTSERSHRGSKDGLGLQPEVFGKGYEAVGNATNGRWRQCNSEIGSVSQLNEGCADTSECSEIESSLGRDAYEPSIGVGLSELSGLSHSELAEIREWMVKTDNRTDELRLLGNGVVPATAERAFRFLMEELNK